MKAQISLLIAFFFLFTVSLFAQNQTELWGATQAGGNDGKGVVFKTNVEGNQEVVYSFDFETHGASPSYSKLCKASNDKLYGMTPSGGALNYGVIFEFDPEINSYIKKFDFSNQQGGTPNGSLIQASNGKLYGMTSQGGVYNGGVIFEYDPLNNSYVKKFDFDGINNGRNPYGSLMEAANGKLYGMTANGGVNGKGVLFEFDISTNTFTKKLDFNGTINGQTPYGHLLEISSGKLYGITCNGGINNGGVIFEYDYTTNIITKKFDFVSSTGINPYGSLMLAGNGKLYGMTMAGGANSVGAIFEYNHLTNVYQRVFSFDGATNGSSPRGDLMEASNGKLYGMTINGGLNNYGVIFEFNAQDLTCIKKFDFNISPNGVAPIGTLIETENGKLFGMTSQGGAANYGVLFEYNVVSDEFLKRKDLNFLPNGSSPYSIMTLAPNGKLYGTTYYGGQYNFGVIYEFDPIDNTFTKKIDFDGANCGRNPRSGLLLASNGKFYGVTSSGGTNERGVLFEYDYQLNSLTVKYVFDLTLGGNPLGKPLQATNGKIYGTTVNGGTYNYGSLYEYDISTNTFTKRADFNSSVTGNGSYSSLIQIPTGKIYGMNVSGGSASNGVIFEFDPLTYNLTKKKDLVAATTGGMPAGALTYSNNGKLYGLTQIGGTSNKGVLFEYDPVTNNLIKKVDFNITENGATPMSDLLLASNGKLYGTTTRGGVNNLGVFFEYSPTTGVLSKKLDFNGPNGSFPSFGTLVEICVQPKITRNPENVSVCPGGNVKFMSAASGNGIIYQWQVNDGSGFIDISDNDMYSGSLDDTLKINNVQSSMNMWEFRCVASSSCPNASINSNTALLTVYPVYEYVLNEEICEGETFAWRGTDYTTSGTYNDNLQSMQGCDSVYVLNLTVNPVYEYIQNEEICEGETFAWRGTDYTASGTYYDNLQSIQGCDSIYVLNLTVNPIYEYIQDEEICEGETFAWRGTDYTTSGTYYDNLQSMQGCDSVYVLNLTVNPFYEYIQNEEICEGETFAWRGTDYTTSGTYYDNLQSMQGCDSIYVLNLTVNPIYEYIQDEEICEGETFAWRGADYTASGTYYDNLQSMQGCDSIYVLNLTVNPVYKYIQDEEICEGETFAWRGTDYTASGTYYDNLQSMQGCDSVYVLNLTVNPVYKYIQDEEICEGETFAWRGTDYTTSGTYYDNLQSMQGCDSVYVLNLTVNPFYEYIQNEEICEGETFAWHGTDYTASGTYYDNLQSMQGCDSIYVLNLTVNPIYEYIQDEEICEGETFAWRGTDYTTSGTYYDNLQSMQGCDSIYVLNITVNPVYESVQDEEICEGEIFAWRGTDYTASGTYYDNLQSMQGCDSVYVLNLTVNPVYEYIQNEEICEGESFLWRGTDYNIAGTYFENLHTIHGCDSIYVLNLSVSEINSEVSINGNTITVAEDDADYQWVDCDKDNAPIPGENNKQFTAKTSGNYAAIITLGNCTEISTCAVITIVGISEKLLNDNIAVFPNPTEGLFTIDLGKINSEVKLRISDMHGRLIKNILIKDVRIVSEYIHGAAGLYMLEIITGDKKSVVKIIKY